MLYPTIDMVNGADRVTICRWYRFLRSPLDENERKVLNLIVERFKNFGGFTPSISKEIGWDPKERNNILARSMPCLQKTR